MEEPIISVSGLRGIVGKSLTAEIAQRYASALIQTLPPGPIVISRDGRGSGPMLAAALRACLTHAGRNVLDADVAATPTTGVLVRQRQAAGGVQISASHNPAEYNGLKLFSAAGRVIPAANGEQVMAAYRQLTASPFDTSPVEKTQLVTPIADTTTAHWELIRACVDVAAIRRRKFRVLLDANHGAGSILGKRLLQELDCRVTVVGEPPDGKFVHLPEPTAENLQGVLRQVTELRADVGFCQDPDADRLAVIDASGRYLGEEYTLAMCVDHVLRQHPGPVVTNCSTSRMSEDLAARYHVPFFRSAVGEANVVDCMLANNAVIGGEGNGGAIDPRVVLVRDSFIGMALLLDAMAARSASIAQLADELPRYEIVKTKFTLASDRLPAALNALRLHFSDARFSTLDGLRLDWPGRWLLVRASNTEPIVRAIAEAASHSEADRLCRETGEVIRKLGQLAGS